MQSAIIPDIGGVAYQWSFRTAADPYLPPSIFSYPNQKVVHFFCGNSATTNNLFLTATH
jgi:hypothetical protein